MLLLWALKTDNMRSYLNSMIIVFLLSSLVLDAQTDVTIRRKEFKTDKAGFEEAWKHVNDGDDYFSEKGVWYGNSFDEYLKALVYNNSNPELNYKTGVSALFSDKKDEAAGFLLRAIELKKDITEDILLLTGRALQYTGMFSDAKEKYNSYLSSPGKKSKENIALAQKCITECNSAVIVTKDTLRIGIENIGTNINSVTDEYSELFSTDGKTLYFASRRELPNSGKRYEDTKFDENIFISKKVNGSFEMAIPAGKELTTKLCETPLYLNSEGNILYIYAGYENGGDIKMSTNKKGVWRAPEVIPFNINTGGSETSFTFSPSGNEIYYVTDNGKDNLGGKDIYFIKRMNERKWSKPQNAGSLINSLYDEESVRFSKTGDTLWFSSKGHNTIGGFDIFYSVMNKAGEWDSVKNAGYPVNTPWDELFYQPSMTDDSLFYFVSNRNGGIGGLDIYQGKILPPLPKPVPVVIVPPAPPKRDTVVIRDTIVVIKEVVAPPPPPPVVHPEPVKEVVLYLIGKVKDSDSAEPVMAKIEIIDRSTNLVVATSASSEVDGSYRIKLPAKKSYMIDLKATGFLSEMKRIDVPENWSNEVYNLNLELIKVKVGKKVVLNNILFETGKAVLTSGSSTELDRLYNLMLENPLMKIEVSGHTDKTGSETVNLTLSESRAKTVVMYLMRKGIERSRIQYKGYGSSQAIADNATAQGRAKNRRVEFKILEF